MANIVLKKWMEPYVLLETLKQNYDMKEFTFDGWTKQSVKADFFKSLNTQPDSVGLYMKNVNKFYLIKGVKSLNLEKLFNLSESDFDFNEDAETSLSLVDMGKAEASFIKF